MRRASRALHSRRAPAGVAVGSRASAPGRSGRPPAPAGLAILAALALALALALTGCGGAGGGATTAGPTTTVATTPPPRATTSTAGGITRTLRGQGETGATVLRPAAAGRRRLPVVLFLHGWTAVSPLVYEAWIDHLVGEGQEVIFPTYQAPPFLAPRTAFGAMVVGIRAALADRDAPVLREGWVVAGHSAGGALGADYAAAAHRLGLPVPVAVFSAYPGRRIKRLPPTLPTVDPAGTSPSTRFEVLYGADDQTVGDATARRIAASARRAGAPVVLHEVRDPAVDDHLGPQRAGPATRRAFWAPLDALIRRARR